MLAGYKAPGSLTMTLATQADAKYDPIVEATVTLVQRYAAWIWEGRTSHARR